MERGPNVSQRDRRLDLLAAHMAGFDPDAPRARDRLEEELGTGLTTLLVAALSRRSAPVPLARTRLVAAAA
jgi:hypothetical protein